MPAPLLRSVEEGVLGGTLSDGGDYSSGSAYVVTGGMDVDCVTSQTAISQRAHFGLPADDGDGQAGSAVSRGGCRPQGREASLPHGAYTAAQHLAQHWPVRDQLRGVEVADVILVCAIQEDDPVHGEQ